MTGGEIVGNVTAGPVANTLGLAGGTITGTVTLGNGGDGGFNVQQHAKAVPSIKPVFT